MPVSATSGRPSSSGRGRRTSTRSNIDEPSTSTETAVVVEPEENAVYYAVSKRDEFRALLVGRLFAIMREQRDKTAAILENLGGETEKRLDPLNGHILSLEQRAYGMNLEEMLKDPNYATFLTMNPEIEEVHENMNNKLLDPIEVKIEDVENSTAQPSVSNSVIPSFETHVEKAAKREAHVLSRITELRKNGLWSNSRLPKCVEPQRNKTHWDYLLEEVKWMARDFRAETNNKKIVARKLAGAIHKVHRDREIEIERAAERAIRDKKKLCANVAKMVREFWQSVDKVVDNRAREILESRVQKAKNKHLMFMIGQVDEMSNIVQEGLVSSKTPSIASHDDDKEYSAGEESEEDDERTIDNEEKSLRKEDVKNEIDALNNDANVEIDDFLLSLPEEYLMSQYGLTQQDIDEIRKEAKAEKLKQKEQPKVVEIDEKMDTTSSAALEAQKPTTSEEEEKSQDDLAEDGNGDGRGVLENVDYLKLNSENSDERQKELANIAEEALKFQPKGYTLETTQVKTPVPFLIRGQLREYQMVGLDWMVTLYEKNLNGILADEMGLGKTIQTISLLAHLACSQSIWGPHLIVVPTSVILNWEMEFKKWCPALKILTYFGSAKERAEKRKGWTKANTFHVCITSYKTVTQDIRSFKQRAWQYLILDEAQNIKNWKSQRWQALLNVRARRRLLLTGTPLQNSLMELWSLMHFLMPTIFSSHDDFKDWFSNPLSGMMDGNVEFSAPLVQRLHKVLRPFILRRLKAEVEKQLPAKTEHIVNCELSKRQRYLYDDFMSRRSTKDNLKSGNMMSVLNIVMQLRKCCNHPNLFEPRPVVAPFVIQKRQIDVPAYLFEIGQQMEYAVVPQMFNLSERIGTRQTQVPSRKPLIEEIESYDEIYDDVNLVPPMVEGFKFSRNAYTKLPVRDLQPQRLDPNASEEEVKTNGKTFKRPMKNTDSVSYQSNRSIATIRSKTVLNTVPLTIATERSGFHFTMSNSGSRSVLDPNAPQSPPLKKPKMTGAPVNFADYVPAHVLERIEAGRKNQLEIVRRRFGQIRTPIIASEIIDLLVREVQGNRPMLSKKRDQFIEEVLNEYIGVLSNRFGMYVEPVLTDAWQCRPSSSGLPSYIRHNMSKIEKDSRQFLLNSSSDLEERLSTSRSLQFPELRLIEYDCGKLQTLAILLRQLYVHKHRCLIFTQMSKMLDILQTFLSHHGYQYFRLDGSTGIEQRQAMMERFNADSKVFCFILSTRSGGVGVNLTGADTVIFYDSDWNPTMDAQAQDRCHRIGQTRNVSIYRLISERTIEENILKKATQKRRLGELAIDEAGFTPDFFKQSDSIRDLFDGENVDISAPVDVPVNEKELEKVMEKCEDEADVNAAKLAAAEAKVDVAEFDDSAKAVSSKLVNDDDCDDKYMELINQLKPIERYAIGFLEEEYKPDFEEEVKEAEALIEQKREEWDQKMQESQNEDDAKSNNDGESSAYAEKDDLDFYLGGNFIDELLAQGFDDEIMPCWLPPSPPMSDNEFDMKMEDDGFDLIYELDPMNEAQLPSQIYELRRPLSEKQKQKEPTLGDILTQNQRVEVRDAVEKCLQFPSEIEPAAAAASPAYTENSFSLDESSQDARPDAELSRTVTSAQLSQRTQKRRSQQRMKNYEVGVKRATTPPKADREEHDYDGAEWSIIEDFCLLQAVQSEMTNSHDVEKVHVPVHPKRRNDGMMLNWEYVASTVNKTTRFYRSARQCSIRYQMFVRPKELGQLVTSDPISKKTVKVELSSNELAHLRKGRITTESQYLHDCSTILDKRHFNRFKMVKLIAQKKNPPFWRGPKETRRLDSLLGKMPASYEEKLNNINYGVILDAEAVAWVPESEMTVNDVQKKKVEKPPAPRAPSPTPRAHHVYRRNYAMPPSKNAEVLPKRKEMYIPVPELHIPQPPPRLQHTVSSQAISSMDHGHQMVQQQQQPQQLTQAQSQHQQHHQIIQQPMREQSVGQHLIQVQQHNQATLQRRTASMANVQTHYIQQSGVMNQGQGQSYVVVNSPASSGPNEGGVQHTTSVQQGQRITQYVNPQQIQQQSGNPRGGPMYTSNPQMVVQTANRGAPQRVMRGGANRMIVQQSGERQAYVMQQSQPVRVRVLPTAQRVVQQPGIGQRRAVHPQPGTVAAMVLPNRVGGTQLRNIPTHYSRRPYQGQAGRIHVNVGPQNQRLQQGPGRTMTTAHVVTSGQGVSRQVMGPGRPLPSLGSRVDSPQTQTVAQVVLAPPSSNVSSSSTGSTMNSQAPPVLHSQPRQAIIVQSEQSHAAHSTAGHPATSQHSQQPSQPQPQSVQQQPPLQQSQPQSSAPQQNQ